MFWAVWEILEVIKYNLVILQMKKLKKKLYETCELVRHFSSTGVRKLSSLTNNKTINRVYYMAKCILTAKLLVGWES